MFREVGLGIFSYKPLEILLDSLWEWIYDVEQWYAEPYSELLFSPQNKRPGKILEASPTNRRRLHKRLQDDVPWNLIVFGTPRGILSKSVSEYSKGLYVTIKSYPQPKRGAENYRHPSYLSIIVDPNIFLDDKKTIEFIHLGARIWSITEGVYGFIDIDTGIPPSDNLARNIACVVSNLIPPEHFQEFKEWQDILPVLNKRLWKAFWGNYISIEHIQQLGGYAKMRRADWYRPQSEILDESWQKGKFLLKEEIGELLELSNKGYFFRSSTSPLDWLEPETQRKRKKIQEVLASISIPTYSSK
jgi:hypothetical protein